MLYDEFVHGLKWRDKGARNIADVDADAARSATFRDCAEDDRSPSITGPQSGEAKEQLQPFLSYRL